MPLNFKTKPIRMLARGVSKLDSKINKGIGQAQNFVDNAANKVENVANQGITTVKNVADKTGTIIRKAGNAASNFGGDIALAGAALGQPEIAGLGVGLSALGSQGKQFGNQIKNAGSKLQPIQIQAPSIQNIANNAAQSIANSVRVKSSDSNPIEKSIPNSDNTPAITYH
jgi:hypothetical protein